MSMNQQGGYPGEGGYGGGYQDQGGVPQQGGYAGPGGYQDQGGYAGQGGVPQQGGYQAAPGGYPQQGYAVDPNAWGAPPAPKKRSLKTVLIVLGVALLLVGGIVGYAVYDQTKNMGTYKLVAPTTFNGLVQDDSNSVVQSMQAKGNGALGAADATPVITSYSTAAGDKLPKLLVIGAYGDLLVPSVQLDEAWKSVATGGNTVTGKTDEPTGSLGGAMQCAMVQEEGLYFPTCAWADTSTLAMVMDSGHLHDANADLSALAATTLQLRTQMEIKK